MDRGPKHDRTFPQVFRDEIRNLDAQSRPNTSVYATIPPWIDDIFEDAMIGGKKKTTVVQAAIIEWAMEHHPKRVPRSARG